MTIGKASTHVGPVIGRGKKAGPIGRAPIHGSALTKDQDRTKVAYPTTTTTTTTTAAPTTTTTTTS